MTLADALARIRALEAELAVLRVGADDELRLDRLSPMGDMARLRSRLDDLAGAARGLVDSAGNLKGIAGHDSLLLRKHAAPCDRLDFCVVRHVLRQAQRVRKVLRAGGEVV